MGHGLSSVFRLMALGLALVAIVILVVLAPRLFGLEATSWWVTVAVGALIGATVVIVGYVRRDSGESRTEPPGP